MKRLKRTAFFLVLLLLFFAGGISFADEGKRPLSLKGIEFLTGFGKANLEEKEHHYQLIPFFVDFDFDLKPLLQKKGINYPGLIQFVEEPFFSYVFEPNDNIEFGNNFLIKIGILPETSKFQPYFKGGLGMVYITQHTREQGTQFNFNEYWGAGLHYFFKKNVAFTVEYRYRHLSNADIGKPNSGIATHFGIFGISYLF